MKITDTISVNPGKTALGLKEESSNIFRTNVVKHEIESKRFDLLSLVYPSTTSGILGFKKYSLPLRSLFATILIVSGITIIENPIGIHGTGFGVVEIVFGSLLALGFLTRPVMTGAAIFYAVSTALELRGGVSDITSLTLMFGSFLFCITGAGKYSVDTLIRGAIKRHIKRTKIKKCDLAMGYKAFHYAR